MTVTPPPKPKGLLKWAFLLPCYLYRWHLGWMLGHRALMVTHIGRKTGLRRQTVLEVVHYDPATQECIVVAGWGKQTDWYRNLQAHPALEVQVGSTRYPPVQLCWLLGTSVLKTDERAPFFVPQPPNNARQSYAFFLDSRQFYEGRGSKISHFSFSTSCSK